jgi:hypothetical protein
MGLQALNLLVGLARMGSIPEQSSDTPPISVGGFFIYPQKTRKESHVRHSAVYVAVWV